MRARKPGCGKRGLIVTGVLVACGGASAALGDGLPTWSIKPPSQSTVATTADLSIALPAELSATQLASLAVDIDHIDVTALAHIGAGAITYHPLQPFDIGAHELRVVEYASGRIVARGQWSFSVTADGHATASRGWSVKGNVGGTVSERVAESGLTQPTPPGFTVNGTFDVKAVRTISEWTAEASINGLYGTDNGTSAIAGQAVQPGQMQLALKHQKDAVVLGDQTLPFDNLLISGLARRGVSGHVAGLPLGADATAFSVRDTSLAGFYGGLGVGDSGNIVSGGILQSHPLPSAPKALTLQAGFITGSSPGGLSTVVPYPGNNGSFPPNSPLGPVATVQSGSGNAWVIGANSEIPGTRLHVNGQYASSRFDFPGALGQSDDAGRRRCLQSRARHDAAARQALESRGERHLPGHRHVLHEPCESDARA